MAESTERRKKAKKKPQGGHDDAAKPKKKKRAPEQARVNDAGAVKGVSFSATDILARILPVLSLLLAFCAIVLLYRRFMPRVAQTAATGSANASDTQLVTSSSAQSGYEGLEDPWTTSGTFTTGNVELDYQVKAFCDALTVEGNSAAENAQNIFNTIVWSELEARGENQEPHGDEWAIVSAKHYFSGGYPEEGIGGMGDSYEFSAAISYCLQYFGYDDAYAVPIVRGDASTGQESCAVVVVTDEYGHKRVCDPQLLANGWMNDLDEYDLVVENIGQDLKKAEERGLKVQKDEPAKSSSSMSTGQTETTSGGSSRDSSTSSSSSGSSSSSSSYDESGTYDTYDEYGSYGAYDAYGYDAYGYDAYGYDYL